MRKMLQKTLIPRMDGKITPTYILEIHTFLCAISALSWKLQRCHLRAFIKESDMPHVRLLPHNCLFD